MGQTGDLVASTKGATGLKHYVSPKDANSPVVLKADKVPAGLVWGTDIEWRVNGQPQAVQGAADKVSISRATPKRFEVTLWDKENNKLRDTMIVWIVWANIGPQFAGPQKTAEFLAAFPSRPSWKAVERLMFAQASTATIQPPTLFDLNTDVPDLRTKLPDGDPLLGGQDLLGRPLAKGVSALWDMSRRVAVRSTNPPFVAPNPLDQNTDFPADGIVGNDDGDVTNEQNDPYVAGPYRGTLYENDQVVRSGPGDGGTKGGYSSRGDTYVSMIYFQDFARVRLGPTWFVISDPSRWRVEYHMKKISQTEQDWQTDTNGVNGIENRVMFETDQAFRTQQTPNGIDWDGDGNVAAADVGLWLDDATYVSFGRNDNAGYP